MEVCWERRGQHRSLRELSNALTNVRGRCDELGHDFGLEYHELTLQQYVPEPSSATRAIDSIEPVEKRAGWVREGVN